MRKELSKKSLMIVAAMSLLIGTTGTTFAQDTTVKPRKSEWTAATAPKDNVIQITPKSSNKDSVVAKVAPSAGNSTFTDGRVIVKYKKGFSSTSTPIFDPSTLEKSIKVPSINALIVNLPKSTNVEQLLTQLNSDPNVQYAEPDHMLEKASSTPDDTYFANQWALLNTGQDPAGQNEPGLPGIDIKATEAWTITKGSSDLIVAVIDTGIAIDNPDLTNNIWTNKKDYPNNNIDDDHNGYIDDINGWNFIGNNPQLYNPVDGDFHGTIVAGIIAASMNNGIGIAGIAPNVKIMPLKFLGPDYGLESDLIQAIEYAERNGAKIANISAEMFDQSQSLKDVIDASTMLFVTAAGNYGVNTDSIPAYPASYDSPNILSVTSVDNTGNIGEGANIGVKSVDVAAPGQAVLSTIPTNNPGLSAEIDYGTSGGKAIFNGIAFENFPDLDERQDAYDRAMNYLGATKEDMDTNILLVQDDLSNMTPYASDPKLSTYKALLADYQGIDLTDGSEDVVISAPKAGDGPSLATMQKYKVVVWFTGLAARDKLNNLTENDQENLKKYLEGGGHLLLTGSHSLNNIEYSPFVNDVLHLAFQEEFTWADIEGVSGTIYDGVSYDLHNDDDIDSFNWVISRDPAIAKINLQFIMPYPKSVYAFSRGTSIAAAHASGVAALVLSQDPTLTAEAIKQRIMMSGTRLSSLTGRIASGSMINAYQALSDDEIPGTPFFGDSISNRLNEKTDQNDVYAVDLHAGENVSFSMTADNGTDFDLYLYAPSTSSINSREGIIAFSENEKTSTESINYKVTESGTYYLDLYAYKGSGAYTLTVKTDNHNGIYEDTSSSVVFNGPWTQAIDAAYSGQSAKQIDHAGTIEMAFVGSYINWIGSKNDKQGIADVYIDGIKVASPSLFSKTSSTKQSILEKMIPYGQHTLTIAWTGKSDPDAKKSGTTFINMDAITVSQLIQEEDPTTIFAGDWLVNFSLKNFGGIAKYTKTSGSSAQFKFEGTKVQLIAYTGTNRGEANIYIDDVLVTPNPIDMYSATTKYRSTVFESATLTPGAHTLKVVNAGTKNPLSSGTYIAVDAISIIQ
ncbi:hypothetical protein EHS13_03840 [Paenibacillus psychroresistens]|uniref:Uncharacterized protein n=1 Tax=Paenibacillus psychroresistens TaxID=1778678 RepID=A0A6B8RFF0_9BACL|nr:S8 family serine peptidase [Paenibacillus psychroresistens]QGQ94096.1 hypothetical protein EHS13_03840 [Paenibacillus psychroresistens]